MSNYYEYIMSDHLGDTFGNNTVNNFTWLEIVAYKNESQGAYGRDKNSIQTGATLGNFKFLIEFDSIMETVTHDYGTYDSILSRLAQKGVEFGKTIAESSIFVNAGMGAITSEKNNIQQTAGAAADGAFKSDVPRFKVDSAYIYQDSGRRQYDFSIDLTVYRSGGSSREIDIVNPVKQLQELSCASVTGYIGIDFPAVFSIKTTPGNLINIKYCALKAVQPTYNGPWVNGLPTHCKLQLTFEELIPLYSRNITNPDEPQNIVVEDTAAAAREFEGFIRGVHNSPQQKNKPVKKVKENEVYEF